MSLNQMLGKTQGTKKIDMIMITAVQTGGGSLIIRFRIDLGLGIVRLGRFRSSLKCRVMYPRGVSIKSGVPRSLEHRYHRKIGRMQCVTSQDGELIQNTTCVCMKLLGRNAAQWANSLS